MRKETEQVWAGVFCNHLTWMMYRLPYAARIYIQGFLTFVIMFFLCVFFLRGTKVWAGAFCNYLTWMMYRLPYAGRVDV